MGESSELHEGIVASYRSIARALDRFMLPRLIELGLTMPQFKAMLAVCSAGVDGVSVTRLATELGIGQPSASLIVDQLVRLAYVERVPDTVDRRRVLVKPTPLGMDTAMELRLGRRSTFRTWLGQLEEGDAIALEQGLRSLAKIVQAPAAAPVR